MYVVLFFTFLNLKYIDNLLANEGWFLKYQSGTMLYVYKFVKGQPYI